MRGILDHIKEFTDLTPELEAEVVGLLRHRRLRRGETIHGAINLGSYAYYIESGASRLYYTLGGKEHTVAFTFPGEFIGVSRYVLANYPDSISIQFLEPTLITYVPHMQMKDVLKDSGAVADTAALLVLNTALNHYALTLEERVHVLHTLSAEERFQWVIRRYPRIMECANLTQIASYLGLSKETLYRIRGGKYVPVK